jgi:hypothetical protein
MMARRRHWQVRLAAMRRDAAADDLRSGESKTVGSPVPGPPSSRYTEVGTPPTNPPSLALEPRGSTPNRRVALESCMRADRRAAR